MKKDETVNSKKAVVIVTIILLIGLIGITYAALQYQRSGEKENEITTGTLILELDDKASEGITLSPAVPLTDEQGLAQAISYKFVLRNTGTANANYRISLVDDEDAYTEDACTDNRLPHSLLKAAISKNSEPETISVLGDTNDVVDEGVLDSEGNIEYTLKIWISDKADTTIGGTHFHGKIRLEGIVEGRTDYETGE